ncbi:dimethyl sulfoxide reductase anchor subunit family protein [Pelomicrobium methylotrophicum]|uniref:DMSO reductase n=1 Tax=Pelomicrobium methylotrophicum TaxID=2602750 RepID=A0A5C7EL91_9PROT|nr:DmsC/YnfH family molybdoenzyme membrane anchor subunit [Pelomicrobium methylotrophicum]TXF12116.1 DMSO reductase [Pelomicrobium methylotrophicum]
MHPAFSVIFLTTLIGVGQGLFMALYLLHLGAELEVLAPMDEVRFHALGGLIALAFLAAGLLASFFHLGHPERAWRAAAMWRTSWLSREVIVLPAFMALVFLWSLGKFLGWPGMTVLGAVAVVVSLALFVCTGMIYACIKFLQEWHSPLTVVNYLLLGSASGFTFATAWAAYQGEGNVRYLGAWAIALTLMAFVTRSASLIRNARLKPKSSLQTAIGVRHPRIVQKSQGFMGGSFNTREFFHGKPAAVLKGVKWAFLVLVFPVPVILMGVGMQGPSWPVLGAAFVAQYVGLIAERWFFFAQANHPQNLYYQVVS